MNIQIPIKLLGCTERTLPPIYYVNLTFEWVLLVSIFMDICKKEKHLIKNLDIYIYIYVMKNNTINILCDTLFFRDFFFLLFDF